MRARRFSAGLALAALLAATGCGAGDVGSAGNVGSPANAYAEGLARAAADHFLDRYLSSDGRVVRHDQGGDTVSEGQAYAMLLTAATGDERRFTRVWSWTQSHLQRPDGLLSSLWRDGRIADPQAATDADLDAAHALVLAGRRFDRPRLRSDARRLAGAVLAHETADAGHGRRLLVAGPWAVDGRVVNPSYFAPRAYDALASTGQPAAWRDLRLQAIDTLRALARAAPLPPDWGRGSAAAGRLVQSSSPPGAGSGQPASYGFDAVRVPIRMASACDSASRRVAARLWPLLSGADGQVLPRGLDGAPAGGAVRHAVALVGAAGAARAGGRRAATLRLLTWAAAQDRATPTYYGAAWVALGRVLLTTRLAGGCPPSR